LAQQIFCDRKRRDGHQAEFNTVEEQGGKGDEQNGVAGAW
jgi:hypothetical protein